MNSVTIDPASSCQLNKCKRKSTTTSHSRPLFINMKLCHLLIIKKKQNIVIIIYDYQSSSIGIRRFKLTTTTRLLTKTSFSVCCLVYHPSVNLLLKNVFLYKYNNNNYLIKLPKYESENRQFMLLLLLEQTVEWGSWPEKKQEPTGRVNGRVLELFPKILLGNSYCPLSASQY